jgi:hypothetical protein
MTMTATATSSLSLRSCLVSITRTRSIPFIYLSDIPLHLCPSLHIVTTPEIGFRPLCPYRYSGHLFRPYFIMASARIIRSSRIYTLGSRSRILRTVTGPRNGISDLSLPRISSVGTCCVASLDPRMYIEMSIIGVWSQLPGTRTALRLWMI